VRIVVLDGYTLNPGDLSWAPLERLGACTVHDRTAASETVARAQGAQIVLTNKVVLDRAVLAQLPALRYVGVLATGHNIVDTAAAAERGVVVANVPGYGTASVAQLAFALLLELCQRVGDHSAAARAGRWTACADFSFTLAPLVELEGLTLGLVGCGSIGRAVARIAQGFGMRVLATTRSGRVSGVDGVRVVDLETLLRESDVVSLHCPLTAENRELINRERLALMKASAFLINTARGGLVNERDVAEALDAGRLAGAGVDVLSSEPPKPDNPLLRARHCVVTPHLAWATRAARERLLREVVANVAAFLAGTPRNVVR
jgi:glycerate dehydrogenase